VHGWEQFGLLADVIGVIMFALLCLLLFRTARQKMEM
jgi:hypothetical protein